MLGTRVDPAFLLGNLHRHGGIVFFLLALGAVVLLLWLLNRSEKPVHTGSLKPVAVQKL
jgi:hypothetical protein